MSENEGTHIDEKQFVCVICPNSCRLTVWKDSLTNEVKVSGNQCSRGKDYGISEYTNPVRMLITTMRIQNGVLPVIPVRSNEPIPKARIFEAMKTINELSCTAPIKMGDIIIKDFLGLEGINVIASRDMEALKPTEACTTGLDNEAILETQIFDLLQKHLPSTTPQKLQSISKEIVKKIDELV